MSTWIITASLAMLSRLAERNWLVRFFVRSAWLLTHWLTGVSSIQRVCASSSSKASLVADVERCLALSSKLQPVLKGLRDGVLSAEVAAITVRQIKGFPDDSRQPENRGLSKALEGLVAYHALVRRLDAEAKTAYDAHNAEHERMLMELWNALMPNDQLDARISKRWTEIGFQGDDPSTDFRGMGILGLKNLLYFAKSYPEIAQQALLESRHPRRWYSFAIVGINITSTVLGYFRSRMALAYATHHNSQADEKRFNDLYCYMFLRFNRLWVESDPPNVMEFNRIFSEVQQDVEKQLVDNIDAIELHVSQ